jgi:hypothetical protein
VNRWKSLWDSRNSQKQSKSTQKRRKTKKPQVPDRTRNCTATDSARIQEGPRPHRPHDSSRRWLQIDETIFALVCCAFQRPSTTQSRRDLSLKVSGIPGIYMRFWVWVYIDSAATRNGVGRFRNQDLTGLILLLQNLTGVIPPPGLAEKFGDWHTSVVKIAKFFFCFRLLFLFFQGKKWTQVIT